MTATEVSIRFCAYLRVHFGISLSFSVFCDVSFCVSIILLLSGSDFFIFVYYTTDMSAMQTKNKKIMNFFPIFASKKRKTRVDEERSLLLIHFRFHKMVCSP